MHWGKSSFIVLHHKRIMSQLQSKSACKMLGSSSELRAWHMPVGMWSNFASNHDRALTPCLLTRYAKRLLLKSSQGKTIKVKRIVNVKV